MVVSLSLFSMVAAGNTCSRSRHCGRLSPPGCERNVTPYRAWGGIGNMLPVYGSAAMPAFALNCTPRIDERGRAFHLQEFLLPPAVIPTPRASRQPHCVMRALMSRPADAVAQRVARVHAQLQTAELRPGEPRRAAPRTRTAAARRRAS